MENPVNTLKIKHYKFLFESASDSAGLRVDKFLSDKLANLTRVGIQRLIKDGLVLVNDKSVKASYKLISGDNLLVTVPEKEGSDLAPQDIVLDIVFEDKDLIVVNKPRGMVVHPGAGNPDNTLVNGLLFHCGTLSTYGAPIRPGIVHRIDKDTSGLLVVAKTDRAYLGLTEQFKDKSAGRIYEAICWGLVRKDRGVIDKAIGRDRVNPVKISSNSKSAKKAVTHFEVIKRYNYFTHIRLRLETGRTHQIRVHLADMKHPIVGDSLYTSRIAPQKVDDNIKRYLKSLTVQMLHAKTLRFDSPVNDDKLSFDSELPDDMGELLRLLNEFGG